MEKKNQFNLTNGLAGFNNIGIDSLLQAERFTIASVEGNSVTIEGDLNFVHFGEIYEGLDMRAEVGMLTRNIKARFTQSHVSWPG